MLWGIDDVRPPVSEFPQVETRYRPDFNAERNPALDLRKPVAEDTLNSSGVLPSSSL